MNVGLSNPTEERPCPFCSATFTVGESFVAINYGRPSADSDGDYKAIGSYLYSHRSSEEAARSIQELDDVLRPHGIVYGLHGSRCYQIEVARAQAEIAARLLRKAHFKIGRVYLYGHYAAWRTQAARWILHLVDRARVAQFMVRLWFFRRGARRQSP